MNLILVRADDIDGARRTVLRGERARHVASVIGARPGDILRAGVVRGPVGQARVVAVGDDRVDLEIELTGVPPVPPAIDLVFALPRPKVLSRALETAASFGVRRIDLVNAWRVDKSYFSSRRLDAGELEDSLVRGCEQGGTTWVPEIEVHRLLVPFLQRFETALDPAARKLLAHPGAPRTIEAVLTGGTRGRVVAAIGPEGGWIETELESFSRLGFEPVSIGARVLRVETAIAALLAQVELLSRLRD